MKTGQKGRHRSQLILSYAYESTFNRLAYGSFKKLTVGPGWELMGSSTT